MNVTITESMLKTLGTVIALMTAAIGLYAKITNFFPALRLSLAIAKAIKYSKIGILSEETSLEAMIKEKPIFKKCKIERIHKDRSAMIAEYDILVLSWSDCISGNYRYEDILSLKNPKTYLLIYASPSSIDRDIMNKLAEDENIIITNMRGRLRSDLLTALLQLS